MVIMTLRLTTPPEKTADAVAITNSMVGPISVDPGCNNITVYSNTYNDDDLMLMVERESQKALEQHIQSDEFRKILEVMELAGRPPEIRFYTISDSAGFELVEALRG